MAESATTFLDAPVEHIDLGDSRLALRRFGSGQPLLLVHGFPLSGFTWRKIIPELSKRWTCYAVDLPGLGESVWTDRTDFSFPGQGRTLKALVEALGWTQYYVLAQDTGGTFARYLALADIDRVEKLALINTEMPGHRPPFIPLYQFLLRLPGSVAPFKVLLRSRTFLRSAMGFGGCFQDLSLIEDDFQEHVIAPMLNSPKRMEGMRRYLCGAVWPPVDALEHEHAKLHMPVRLIWSSDDPTFPVDLARKMLSQFPRADIVEIPGAKLLIHEEKPDAVAKAVVDFFI